MRLSDRSGLHRRRRASSRRSGTRLDWNNRLVLLLVLGVVLVLPLLLGNRTPQTLSLSLLLLVGGAFLVVVVRWIPLLWSATSHPAGVSGRLSVADLPRGWLAFGGAFTAIVLLQVIPVTPLAALGPYPSGLVDGGFQPRFWSPDPGATLRGWAAFLALVVLAWVAYTAPARMRGWLWLALVAMGVFQAIYGVYLHASGGREILGIFPRAHLDTIHGTFSNRNLFAGYLALIWPLSVAIWWMREMPLLSRLPREIRYVGAVLTAMVVGAGLLASGSRLGSAAAIVGMLFGVWLWWRTVPRRGLRDVWPLVAGLFGLLLLAVWFGLGPLLTRALSGGLGDRGITFAIMLQEFPKLWYLHGVGLGGFEAAYKPFQPAVQQYWFDYAHNDLLQWWVEMGIAGMILLGVVAWRLWRARSPLTVERMALYAALLALALIGLGDFSWHIPATQAALALVIGSLLRSPEATADDALTAAPEPHAGDGKRRRRRRRSTRHRSGSRADA